MNLPSWLSRNDNNSNNNFVQIKRYHARDVIYLKKFMYQQFKVIFVSAFGVAGDE